MTHRDHSAGKEGKKRLSGPGKTVVGQASECSTTAPCSGRLMTSCSEGRRSRLTRTSRLACWVRPVPGAHHRPHAGRKIRHSGVRVPRRVNSDLVIPYTIQTGFGIEQKLSRKLIASLDYIFTRGAHLWRETNINAPRLPEGFASFTDYLMSRDFDNRRDASGTRAISGANADVVRFDLSANTSTTAGAIAVVNGVRLLTLGLNTPRSSNISSALNAVRALRPDHR